ncbi:PLP-dependent aminotransferase family protein [Hansschlegelia zhihuaiae]|uniref:PLP-dependent aminotransferase family protein n=1 Tax=Hansschlegelia zhihuaiae TaxID=405005 RepID=A0A4V1KJN0_9HYPH|nr:PLP-dependent aminotransferase family protein [Hansschlegelia zhihuaiae]RXF74762.1 PLP-dependent aminotransferase family protein [Hansschlegelia zhihuaiae]
MADREAHVTLADRWAPSLSPEAGPLYLQIANSIADAVKTGALREGDRLPPQRALAQALSVDLTTVTRAYAEARRRNLLDAVTGRGSFIAGRGDPSAPPLDLGMNIPPPPRGVRLADELERSVRDLAARSNLDALMSYHPGAGSPADRAAGAAWLRPTLGSVDPDRILVAAGAQSAMASIATMLAGAGDEVACEPLVYPGLLSIARHLRLEPVAIEADADGMSPEALDARCRKARPAFVYLNPTIGNPTSITMPDARRRALIEVARGHGLALLEDDPYSPLAGDAPPPLAALAPDVVWHVHTVSKCLTPGFRIAYVVAPSASARSDLAAALRAMSLMAPPLMAAVLGGWIRDGVAREFLDGVRTEAAARQILARRALPVAQRAHPNGLHVWLPLAERWDRRRVADRARAQGLAVVPSDAFSVSARPPVDAIRISLGAIPERARLAAALATLAGVLEDDRGALHDVV